NGPARDSEHSQFATFGVEGDVAVTDHGRCGAVIRRLVQPGNVAGLGVQGVELVAAEAAAEQDEPACDGRRCQRVPSRDGDLPPPDRAVLGLELGWRAHLWHFPAETGVDLHALTSGCRRRERAPSPEGTVCPASSLDNLRKAQEGE